MTSIREVLTRLEGLRVRDLPTHGGSTLAYVYDSGLADVDELGRAALSMFAATNGLDPTAFPSLAAMENDLVRFARDLLDGPAGPDGVVGTVTSGGTESILLAVQAARDANPGIVGPQMVLPTTPPTPRSTRRRTTSGSSPCSSMSTRRRIEPIPPRWRPHSRPHGARRGVGAVLRTRGHRPGHRYRRGRRRPWDPMSRRCLHRGLGAALLAIGAHRPDALDLRRRGGHEHLGRPAQVRLRTQGDLAAPAPHRRPAPGAVLRLGRVAGLHDAQLDDAVDEVRWALGWAWAVVQYLGVDGYAALARQARAGVDALVAGLRDIPALSLVAHPDSTLVTLVTDSSCDVFIVSDEMLARGWFVQPQMSFREMSASLHLTVSAATTPRVGEFLDALRESVAAAVQVGPVRIDPALSRLLMAIDPAALDAAGFAGIIEAAGLVGGDGGLALPVRMAPVNALLDAAPAAVREALLVGVLDLLSRP